MKIRTCIYCRNRCLNYIVKKNHNKDSSNINLYVCQECHERQKLATEKSVLKHMIRLEEEKSGLRKVFKTMTREELIKTCCGFNSNYSKTLDAILKLRLENRYLRGRLIKCDYKYRLMLESNGVDINEYIRE